MLQQFFLSQSLFFFIEVGHKLPIFFLTMGFRKRTSFKFIFLRFAFFLKFYQIFFQFPISNAIRVILRKHVLVNNRSSNDWNFSIGRRMMKLLGRFNSSKSLIPFWIFLLITLRHFNVRIISQTLSFLNCVVCIGMNCKKQQKLIQIHIIRSFLLHVFNSLFHCNSRLIVTLRSD